MIKKSNYIFILLVVFSVTLFGSTVNTQIKGLEKKASLNTVFNSSKVKSLILNTYSFKKRESMDERVILLINWRLYNALKKEVNQFVQDLFDEGIDVWPFLIDHTQFQSSPVSWRMDAGLRLKEFVFAAYYHIGMEKITDRTKKGLIILGALPAAFINWHQEQYRKGDPKWSSLKAENDYKSMSINLTWNSNPDPRVIGYNLSAYEYPDLNDPGTRVLLPGNQPGRIGLRTNFQYMLPLSGQKNFQFEIQAVFNDGTTSVSGFSNIVNWNFLINPSDYVLADIDGFQTIVNRILDYTPDSRTNFGINANPVLVVTAGVKANPDGKELSATDQGRQYARCEMYYGRIDASSLTGAWAAPGVSASLVTDSNINRLTGINRILVSADRNWTEEVRLIRSYLWRNHLWRKSKIIRDSYNRMYIFRSSDFVGKLEEKTVLKDIWKKTRSLKQVLLEDAKKDSGCTDTTKPIVRLYKQTGLQGLIRDIKTDNPDITDPFGNGIDRPHSIRVDHKYGFGGVALYPGVNYTGKPEILRRDDPDLKDNPVGSQAASIRFLSCDDLDCLLKRKPLVTLFPDINYQIPPGELIKKETKDLGTTALGSNQASSLQIDLRGTSGAVVLFSQIDYLGADEIFRADDLDLGDNPIGNDTVSSVQLWDCFEANSPEWDNKGHLFRHLKKKWKLVDLGGHGHTYGFTLSKGVVSGNRMRIWDDRAVNQKDIWNLRGDIKFLINHNCHNGQFMAPGNAGTAFLFRNNMLAQWCWAAVGTIEHEVLHRSLRNGDRFGVATMKNFDAQMQAEGSNPWRTYFSAILGDPTLRMVYKQPDLYIKTMAVPKNVRSGKPCVMKVTVGNKGDREVDQPQSSQVLWKIFAKGISKEVVKGNFALLPLRAGESKSFSHTIRKKLSPGIYELRFFVDPEDKVAEGDENNNKGQKEFTVQEKRKEGPEKKSRFHLKVWGLQGKSEEPFFIDGEPNTDSAHQEYTNWQEFETKDGYSLGGNLSFEFFLNKSLSLEVGAAYAERTAYVENLSREGYSDETRLKTLSLPVLLKLNSGGKKVNFFIGGGIEGLFILEVKNHYHWESGGLVYDEIFGADDAKFGKSLVKLLDSPLSLALIGSAGVQLGRLTIEARYFHGLKDIIFDFKDTAFDGQVNAGKLKGILILLGFSF